jgi:hypothetical protein
VDELSQISNSAEFKNIVRKATYYPDHNDLIRSWMKQNWRFKTIDLPEPDDKNSFEAEQYL